MNIDDQQAAEAVALQWKTRWDILHPAFTYFFENKKGIEPENPDTYWARVSLRPTDGNQHTLGRPSERLWRREANVWVQLYAPINEGTETILGLVKDAKAVFEGVSFGGVDPMGAARHVTVGADGRWYQIVVIAPVMYYEQH